MENTQALQLEQFKHPVVKFKERMDKWVYKHLTVDGRAADIYAKNYQAMREKLPKRVKPDKLAAMEQQLMERSKSAAVGSLIFDGVLVGGAVTLGAVVLKKKGPAMMEFFKDKDRMKATVDQWRSSPGRMVRGTLKVGGDFIHQANEAGVKAVPKADKFIREAGRSFVDTITWPARKLGAAGRKVWGMIKQDTGGLDPLKLGARDTVQGIQRLGEGVVDSLFIRDNQVRVATARPTSSPRGNDVGSDITSNAKKDNSAGFWARTLKGAQPHHQTLNRNGKR